MFATCSACGASVTKIEARCPRCKRERTHQECYPEQYSDPLCGKQVTVRTRANFETRGTVVRVVDSRFGRLAFLDTSGDTAYRVTDCRHVVQTVTS